MEKEKVNTHMPHHWHILIKVTNHQKLWGLKKYQKM